MKFSNQSTISKTVKIWLAIGLIMILIQVIIGGITRLTGSGLSITKWDIVMGSIPPLNENLWIEAFDLYKETPQYQKINEGMSMADFKFIYFWEYIHRLWARLMGFVFMIPFVFFLIKGYLSKTLFYQLIVVFLLAILVASLGWIMVASGLINRPLVNAYKLSFHLATAFLLYAYLLWVYLDVTYRNKRTAVSKKIYMLSVFLFCLVCFQIILGGIMSGMKAGLFYPTFPLMHGELIPGVFFDYSLWNVDNLILYDKSPLMPALIQVAHRFTSYLLIIIGLYYFLSVKNTMVNTLYIRGAKLWITMLVIQALIGIFTLIYCVGSIPLALGSLHQAGSLILLTFSLFLVYLRMNITK